MTSAAATDLAAATPLSIGINKLAYYIFDTRQPIFVFLAYTTEYLQKVIINTRNAFYVTALPCNILIVILVMFFTANKRHRFILAISFFQSLFIFHNFEKNRA